MAGPAGKPKAVLLDFLERAGWSAGQVFFATVLAGGTASAAGLPWKYAGILAAGAAVASIVLTALQYLGRATNLSFWPDLIVRLAKTFLGSLAGSIAASKVFDVTTFHWSTALNVAALATISALGKGLLARSSGPASTAPVDSEAPAVGRAAVPQQSVGYDSPSTLLAATYRTAVIRQ